jgi:drug/metabolite transporter (DMT)-like permease
MLASVTLTPVMEGIAKVLSARYPLVEIVWARNLFHFLVLLPLVLHWHGAMVFRPPRPGLQVARGIILLVDTLMFFWAIALIPLADAKALFFVFPLFLTALAAIVLGEKLNRRRAGALLIGFAGALLIMRPGFHSIEWGQILAIGAAFAYALYLMMTRRLALEAPPLVTLAFAGLVGAVVTSLLLPFVWVTPSLSDALLMIAMGALGGFGHFLLVMAFRSSEASLLAPLGYGEIVAAVLFGYLVFGDFPITITWIGIAVIVAGGLMLLNYRRPGSVP